MAITNNQNRHQHSFRWQKQLQKTTISLQQHTDCSGQLRRCPPGCTAKANSAGSGMTVHPPVALGVTTTFAWWIPFDSLDSCVGTCSYYATPFQGRHRKRGLLILVVVAEEGKNDQKPGRFTSSPDTSMNNTNKAHYARKRRRTTAVSSKQTKSKSCLHHTIPQESMCASAPGQLKTTRHKRREDTAR